MLRSLYSAVSGMKAHQSQLDVIGNNIANVNTYGFKSSRARFQDVDFNSKMNSAITRGCGGKAHPGGNFTITATPAENVFQKPLTGAEPLGDHFGINEGTFEFATSTDAR